MTIIQPSATHAMTRSDRDPSARHAAESEILEVERAYDIAWGAGDLDGLLACLTPDAVLVNPYGAAVEGQGAIREELARVLGGSSHAAEHTSTVLRVSLVTDDVAVVDGEAVLRPTGGGEGVFRHRFTDVLVRTTAGWLIAHIRAYRHLEGA